MKVFNLTNVETPKLKRYQMLDHTLLVGKELVAPGSSVEVSPEDEAVVRTHLEHFLEIGAVAIDVVPEAYKVAPTVPAPAKLSHPPTPPRRTRPPTPEG